MTVSLPALIVGLIFILAGLFIRWALRRSPDVGFVYWMKDYYGLTPICTYPIPWIKRLVAHRFGIPITCHRRDAFSMSTITDGKLLKVESGTWRMALYLMLNAHPQASAPSSLKGWVGRQDAIEGTVSVIELNKTFTHGEREVAGRVQEGEPRSGPRSLPKLRVEPADSG